MFSSFHSKLRNFLLITFFCVLFLSCRKNEHSIIPETFVDFTIRLTDPLFIDLNAIGNSVIVDYSYFGPNSAGYKNHGIIVYRASQVEFYAFDRTCTWEETLDQAVDLDLPTDLSAECPKCGSEYVLPSFASPTKDGPAIYPLKQYRTEYSAMKNTVRVYNFP